MMAMPWSNILTPAPIVLPLLVGAFLAGVGGYLPRRLLDGIALLTSAAVLVVSCMLVHASAHGTIVYWLGNWRPALLPQTGKFFPVGICLSIDPIGAGMSAMVGLLSMAAFAFSWLYFEQVRSLYHTLMLAFVAAMCGLCLTGDLFNLFVWFELMTAAAVGLCGYKSEESWPLLGALNFAVVNTVGAFLSLTGVALLYARTGSLNMAEVGRSLASHPPGSAFLLIVFLFVSAGFLVKMAVVPFQFWLADAHAVAPTPVCVLFSGVMVELGLYAVARVHWVVFAPSLGTAGEQPVRDVFLLMGTLGGVVGAVYCFSQRHLKRLLAFSTISHVGLMVMGFALLDPGALSGTAVYMVGHGMIKGSLFLGAGILLHRCGSVDEYDLRGQCGNLWLLGIILVIGAVGLAGMPPFATFYGQDLIHDAFARAHREWLSAVAVIAEALTAGAILRYSARVFLGWGERQEASSRGSPHVPMDSETAGQHDKTPFGMWLPAVLLLALAAGVAVSGQFRQATDAASRHFQQSQKLAAVTLESMNDVPSPRTSPAPVQFHIETPVTLALALGFAALALFPRVLGERLNWVLGRGLIAAMRPLRRLQSGNVSDYVAWFAFGIAGYGGLLLWWHR
jgi:multicomponent Na+:H+ antiporter subunit D